MVEIASPSFDYATTPPRLVGAVDERRLRSGRHATLAPDAGAGVTSSPSAPRTFFPLIRVRDIYRDDRRFVRLKIFGGHHMERTLALKAQDQVTRLRRFG